MVEELQRAVDEGEEEQKQYLLNRGWEFSGEFRLGSEVVEKIVPRCQEKIDAADTDEDEEVKTTTWQRFPSGKTGIGTLRSARVQIGGSYRWLTSRIEE